MVIFYIIFEIQKFLLFFIQSLGYRILKRAFYFYNPFEYSILLYHYLHQNGFLHLIEVNKKRIRWDEQISDSQKSQCSHGYHENAMTNRWLNLQKYIYILKVWVGIFLNTSLRNSHDWLENNLSCHWHSSKLIWHRWK